MTKPKTNREIAEEVVNSFDFEEDQLYSEHDEFEQSERHARESHDEPSEEEVRIASKEFQRSQDPLNRRINLDNSNTHAFACGAKWALDWRKESK